MKKNSSVISLSFLVFFLFVFSVPSVCFSELLDTTVWKYYAEGKAGDYYYNKKTLKKSSNIISVWTYVKISKIQREEYIKGLEETGARVSAIKYWTYDHAMFFWDMNCKERIFRLKKFIHYDSMDNILNNPRDEDGDWNSIPPGSTMDVLLERICVTPEQPFERSSDWVTFGKDNDGNVYSYKKGKTEKEGGQYIVQVFDSIVYSDEGREKIIQNRRKDELSTEGYDNLSNQNNLLEIDCKKRKINLLSVTEYATNGEILFSSSFDKPKWDNIVPDSKADLILKRVCETSKKPSKKKK